MMRDLDKQPYSADEQRVAQWLFDKGAGGGDDPIGFMIASHEALAAERNAYRDTVRKVSAAREKRLAELVEENAQLRAELAKVRP